MFAQGEQGMKKRLIIVVGSVLGIAVFRTLLFQELPDALIEMLDLCFPCLVGHTLWLYPPGPAGRMLRRDMQAR